MTYYLLDTTLTTGQPCVLDLHGFSSALAANNAKEWQLLGFPESDLYIVTRTGKLEFTDIKTKEVFTIANCGFTACAWERFLSEWEDEPNVKTS